MRRVRGWVFCPDHPETTFTIEVLVDGAVVASAQATEFRSDLATFGIGDGSRGFRSVLPAEVFDDRPHLIEVREAVSGWILPSTITTQVLPSRFAQEVIGAVSAVSEDGIAGHAYRTTAPEEPTEIHLHAGGEWVASGGTGLAAPADLQDFDAPAECGFRFALADLPLGALIGQELTVTAATGHRLGVVSPEAFRGLASATFGPVSQGIQGKVTLRTAAHRPTLFHVHADGVAIGRVEVKAGASAATFFIPYEPERPADEISVSIRASQSEIDIAGSPVRLRIGKVDNLVANPDFADWTGAAPTGWSVLCEGAVTATHQFDDARNASPHGPNALRIARTPEATVPEARAGVGGVRISRTLAIPLAAAGGGLDVFVCARAERRMTATLSLVLGKDDSLKDEAASPPAQSLTIWPDWVTHVARLTVPTTLTDPVLDGTLTLRFDDDAPGWVAVALIAAGSPGFSLDTLADARARSAVATQAVPNGDFSTWDQPTLCLTTEGRRFVPLASPWALRCKSDGVAVAVRLTDVVTRDPSTADLGRARYAVALRGTVSEQYLRLECVLDPLQLAVAVPDELRFFAQRASRRDPAYVPVLSENNLIDEISILERELVGASPRDTRLATLRRRVAVEANGRHVVVSIDPETGQALCDLGKRALNAQDRQVVLVFEFRRAVDLALTEVTLGCVPRAAARMAAVPNLLSIEDRNIVNQIDLIKGIADWNSPRIVRPAPNAPAEQAGPMSGLMSAPMPGWRWTEGPGELVDIVIPIHEAVDDVLVCIRSLIAHTTMPHVVTLVDDASSESTRIQLRTAIAGLPWMRLIETDANIGYTRAANLGLAQTRAPWIVLLNSDTIVTPGWLEGLFEAAAGRPEVAMVGPVSNAASWQSVPELRDVAGRWRVNTLPAGTSVNDMAALVARYATREFPEASLLNGFCTLMRRSVVADMGYLDEAAFPMGYGEENDLCIRVTKAGHRLVVADHVYVHHIKSASFGAQRREILSKKGNEALASKHPDIDLAAIQIVLAELTPLTSLRKRLRAHFAQL